MKTKINLTEEQAKEMYYNINSYYLFLTCAENVDKCHFDKLKFWNANMNNHMRKARESMKALLREFNKQFKAIDSDLVEYEAPAELDRVMTYFSRLHPEEISKLMYKLENDELPT